jgi:hypothetical protein
MHEHTHSVEYCPRKTRIDAKEEKRRGEKGEGREGRGEIVERSSTLITAYPDEC